MELAVFGCLVVICLGAFKWMESRPQEGKSKAASVGGLFHLEKLVIDGLIQPSLVGQESASAGEEDDSKRPQLGAGGVEAKLLDQPGLRGLSHVNMH